MKQSKLVFVGLSGGVDSSVAALRLIRRGFDVVGVFIKVWQPDFIRCNWEAERLDAMRVAAHLGIPFLTFDAESAYKQGVADYMIDEYRNGRTPNPDVMCNDVVKFGVFYNWARSMGAQYVATGHYAQIDISQREGFETFRLLRGVDSDKDQSYFLWKLRKEILPHVLFPVGDTTKEKVRFEAKAAQLPTSTKADSQGICFLGPIDIPEFLSHFIPLDRGPVVDEGGVSIGEHRGSLVYTQGQRHGFTVFGDHAQSGPWYVTERNHSANTVTVSRTPPSVEQGTKIVLTDLNILSDPLTPHETYEAQYRYRQRPVPVTLEELIDQGAILRQNTDTREFPSHGQSCVLYRGMECLGGGIIA
jgi:tRNA-uridine 2-sulfurtransferase